jgi:hypothetical protein
MPKYAMEFRVVEIHFYEVEADSIDDAEMIVYDQDLEPMEVSPIAYELDTYEEIEEGEDMLTPAEYNQLRKENADWLSGKEK